MVTFSNSDCTNAIFSSSNFSENMDKYRRNSYLPNSKNNNTPQTNKQTNNQQRNKKKYKTYYLSKAVRSKPTSPSASTVTQALSMVGTPSTCTVLVRVEDHSPEIQCRLQFRNVWLGIISALPLLHSALTRAVCPCRQLMQCLHIKS